jgi:hypothetical protein
MLIVIYSTSLGGWKGNSLFIFSWLLLLVGIILFLYSIFYTIIKKSFNIFIFTPFLLLIFCFVGMYYGEKDERKIHKVADEIRSYYQGDENNISKDEMMENINIPKNMEIKIENGIISIHYKKIIYYPYKGHLVYME